MRFLINFFKWLFYGTPSKESEANATTPENLVQRDIEEPAAPKKPELKVVDLRALADPDDFLDELRSIRLGNDFITDAKQEMLAELRRMAATAARRSQRKDAA